MINLNRYEKNEDGIFGELIKDDEKICLTLEHPELAIPAGKYICIKHTSPKFGKVFKVNFVPDRTDILIHRGNTKKDTSGCILLGMSEGKLDGLQGILSSSVAFMKFMGKVTEDFNLLITDSYNS
ncbi:hypothetical protein KKH82_05460 [Patescibacteria group bacterium]|nr:hypothetical protein [Patescibacteria group bacterium]